MRLRLIRLLPELPLLLIRLAGRRPWPVILVVTLLALLAASAATRLRLDSDLLSLVPAENPVVRDFRETLERFGSTDILLVALELGSEETLDGELAFADLLVDGLRRSPEVAWVECNAGDLAESLDDLLAHATLFMTTEELRRFADRYSPDGLQDRARRLARDARSPVTVGLGQELARDPMGVWSLVGPRFGTRRLSSRFDGDTGYIIDQARRHLLLLVKPVRPAADIPFGRELLAGLEELGDEAGRRWRDEGWSGEPPVMLVGGSYAIAVEDAREVSRDAAVGGVAALAGVILLFAAIYRRFTALLIVALPLTSGLALTFGFATVAFGSLNVVTSAFAALLIGLGVDFIIVLYGRYVEERRRGTPHHLALEAIGRATAPGVLLGAVTTAATFFAFLISGFRGLSELGLITGAGILILALTVFLLLPALLTVIERIRPEKPHRFQTFGLQHLCRFSLRHHRGVTAAVLAVTLLLCIPMFQLRYDDDVLNMRSATNTGLVVQRRLMEAFDIRFTPIMVRVDGADAAESLERAKSLLARLEQLADGVSLARVESAATLMPAPDQQRRNIDFLAGLAVDPASVRRDFDDALDAEGLNPGPFRPGLELALRSLALRRPLSADVFAGSTIGHLMERYFWEAEGQGASTLIYCYPPAGKWRRAVPPPVLEAVAEAPGAVLSSPVLVSLELKRIVWRDALLAALLGLALVFTLMLAGFGSWKRTVLGLLPLALGMIWMAGGLVLLGLPVNFMNIFVFTMIIGIGVDYGIHLTHRWGDTGADPGPLAATSRAILAASLTTIIGFGSLALSHSPGLRSMGAAAILGAAATALVSITLLPALMAWKTGR